MAANDRDRNRIRRRHLLPFMARGCAPAERQARTAVITRPTRKDRRKISKMLVKPLKFARVRGRLHRETGWNGTAIVDLDLRTAAPRSRALFRLYRYAFQASVIVRRRGARSPDRQEKDKRVGSGTQGGPEGIYRPLVFPRRARWRRVCERKLDGIWPLSSFSARQLEA